MTSIIVTDNKHDSINLLNGLNLLTKYYSVVSAQELLEYRDVFNAVRDDCGHIDKIFIDGNINCSRKGFLNAMHDIDASRVRHINHKAIHNADVKIFTFTSAKPLEKKILHVLQLPEIEFADRTIRYAVPIGSDIVCYDVNENGDAFTYAGYFEYSETDGVDQFVGFIGLIKTIACSYYDRVRIVVRNSNIPAGGVSVPVIPRDITFDNETHNIVINI